MVTGGGAFMGKPNLMDVSFDLNVCQVETIPFC